MSDIPQARERIRDLIMDLKSLAVTHTRAADILDDIMFECLYREPPSRKTKPRSKTMTAKLAREIRAHARAHPTASHQQIANVFGVNPGRVSEAIARKW